MKHVPALQVRLRRAVAGDAPTLADFATRTFAETFAGVTPPPDLKAFLAATYSASLQGAEIADPTIDTVLAVLDERLVGFVQLRDGAPPPCVTGARIRELGRFYVDSDCHGAGVGARLMEEALRLAAAAGAAQLWLGVFAHNDRAIRFYGKWGFVPVGEHVFKVGADPQRDLILVRPL